MTAKQRSIIFGFFMRLAAARPTERVSDWCARNVRFREPKLSGPFSFSGREYFREPLDLWASPLITDVVMCFGTRTGKTRILFGGLAWIIEFDSSRVLYVMPNTHGIGGSRNVASTRFIPMIEATESLAKRIPQGTKRYSFKTGQQMIAGSIIDWAGSNSPANLAGNPCNVVIQDEVDKYKRLGDREADPSYLADQRCKEFSNPKRFKVSTPTLMSGLIWQELLKTDLRRRFMPCPHCGKFLAFAWSQDFTVLPTVNVGFVKWDKEARRKDGSWDLDRVENSARVECPHCQGHIRDEQKTKMDQAGEWRPTQEGAPRMRGYHLPSMYSSSVSTRFGQMAVNFLKAKNSIQGLQGIINSDFAEPYEGQESRAKRTVTGAPAVITSDWRLLMTVDCQASRPYFWFVVRAWNGNKSEAAAAGNRDSWEELDEVQKANKVPNVNVSVDSAWGSKSEAEVNMNCARRSDLVKAGDGLVAVGWTPVWGYKGDKRWKDDSGVYLPYSLRAKDPFLGTDEAGRVTIFVLEFASDFFKDVLMNLRLGQGGAQWGVRPEVDTPEYRRHMDGQVKKPVATKFSGRVVDRWEKRSRHWPDHMFACEFQQVARVTFAGWLKLEGEKK